MFERILLVLDGSKNRQATFQIEINPHKTNSFELLIFKDLSQYPMSTPSTWVVV
jgi:hypothetical protein